MLCAGNEAAFRLLLDERAPRLGRPLFESVWGVEATPDGSLVLPEDAAAYNPLLAVMLARLKEGCRLLEHAGEHAIAVAVPSVSGKHVERTGACKPSCQLHSFSDMAFWSFCHANRSLDGLLVYQLSLAVAGALIVRGCLLGSHARGRQRRGARGEAAEAGQQRGRQQQQQRQPAGAVAWAAGAAPLAGERPRGALLRLCG